MSIMNRLNRIIRSNVSDLRGDTGPDSIDKLLSEMESSLRDAKRQAMILRRQEKKLLAEIRAHRESAEQWEDRAMMALKRQQEDLARDALAVRNEALEQAAELREELEAQRVHAEDINRAIQALEMKMAGARGKARNAGNARAGGRVTQRPRSSESAWDAEFRRRVEGQGAAAPSSYSADDDASDFQDERLFREVDRMGSKIDAFEAGVEAMRELSDEELFDPGRSKLDARFRELERRRQRDTDRDDLAALKKKFED
ncbi:PspA/IM30 family protein [Bradymonas sediminis]|uniref:Uncharacterized protein n=1 Tax=Bradymonas sediminis TaxID=1548548 RepID=A0A2Z4FLP5_9DELT|nr:PspA/IM30 family protein [Bradymonas sediminis]AWV89852.1 hypothetical protein DN745_11075 [Bradymonas sediminis]TDP76399.1 phage shock protein A (PspA) family protein [Bradymonas sediminis]